GYSEGRFVSPTRFSPAGMLHNGQLAERRLPILARRREKADALNIQIYSLIGMGNYKTARRLAEQSLQLQPGKSNPAYKYQQYATQKENQVMVPERGIEPPTY